jgi:hypothetical protein
MCDAVNNSEKQLGPAKRKHHALRRTAAGMLEAAKGFRHPEGTHKHLPALRAALVPHQAKHAMKTKLEMTRQAA